MKCFYHTDVDGKCAGAIIKKWWPTAMESLMPDGQSTEESEYIGIDYKDEFPFNDIKENETVIIVDFSLQKEGEFSKLFKITKNIIWIDHHKTAINKHIEFEQLVGIRSCENAGCELTWEFCFANKEMPLAVKYAGRYDIWDFSEHGETLNEFQAGIRLEKHYPENYVWECLLDIEKSEEVLPELLKQGKIALRFRINRYASLIKAFSFFANFEGHKAICCNVGATSSQLFDSVKEDYDLMMPFVFDGRQWTVSIYSTKSIDCSEIAKKYGGGGHKGAAGFQCKELPFNILESS